MATESTKTESVVGGERPSLIKVDEGLALLALLHEACKCSHHQRQLDLLTRCVSCITSCEKSNVEYLMSLGQFREALMCVIDLAIIPAFKAKEYLSYEKEDFQRYPKITDHVLSIIDYILQASTHRNAGVNTNNINIAKSYGEHDREQTQLIRNITFILPKLSLLIGAHTNCPMWSSPKLEALSLQILNRLLFYFSRECPDDLFSMHIYSDDSSAVKVRSGQMTLLEATLSLCWKPLSKDFWHQNPFLCHSFCWLILQMKLPHLSDYIEQIMSVALNFLEDHQTVNKIRGISCLHHLIKNTSAEEMRWLNRAEVVYEKLKNQMYSKEAAVVECLLPCLFDVLKVLESPPELDRHHYVLNSLVRGTEGENLLALRKIYVRNLTVLLEQVGIYSVCHLKTLIKIVGNYLEIDDGFGKMSSRPDTLKLLNVIIRVAWPRIRHHADAILRLSLNFIADINCADFQGEIITDVQSDLTAETIQCLILLSEVCPDVLPCIKAGLRAGMDSVKSDSHFFDILKKELAKTEI